MKKKLDFASFVMCVLSGLLYVMCFPKWNLSGLAWVAFVPLLLVPCRSAGKCFFPGFLAGLVANLGTLYWIYPTCRVANVDPFTSVLAVSSLAAYLALYWGIFAVLRTVSDHRLGAWQPVFLAVTWTALEWIRAYVLTGFPWLPLAYSQWKYPELLGTAEFGGFYALSFLLMLFNALIAQFILDIRAKRWDKNRRLLPAATILLLLFAGTFYLARRPLGPAGEPIAIAVAQGNIDQYKKWDDAYEQEVRNVYSGLADEAAIQDIDLLVWPETAVPGWIPNEPQYVLWLADLARRTSSYLLAGAATHQQHLDYNAAFLVSPAGTLLQQYRKRHLVPFGEIIPFQKILAKWVQVMNELGEMAASDDWTVFRIERGTHQLEKASAAQNHRLALTFGVNICFESLFPDLVRGFIDRGAQATFNLTNDGWFLETAAPEQHFVASVFRAVENRTWVVRAANTGISGFIDPTGRVISRSSLMERVVLLGEIRPMFRRTFYSRFGDLFAFFCFTSMLAWLGVLGYRAVRPVTKI